MHLSVISTNSSDFIKHQAKYDQFLQLVESSDSPAAINMGHEPPAGLVYLLKGKHRWNKDSGELALLHNDETDSIVGISAVEHSTLLPELGSGGNRCWLLPGYRTSNEVTTYLLNSNFNWCKENEKVGMVLTFNDHNKWIYDTVKKLSSNTGTTLGTVWSKWWSDCIILPRRIRYFNTRQWAIIKPIDREECLKLAEEIDKKYGTRDAPYVYTEK